MFSPVATGLFCIRNGNKTSCGDYGRLPVTVAQGAAVVKAGSQYNNPFSRGLKTFIDASDDIAKSDKIYRGLSKTVKFAVDHVNPLIVASSGLKVALAAKEDRRDTLIAETGCIGGMFAGEGWMKNNLDKYLAKLPLGKRWVPIIKGVTFVAGSITASTLGYKAGKKVAQYWDVPLGQDERLAKEQLQVKEDVESEAQTQAPKSISIKA